MARSPSRAVAALNHFRIMSMFTVQVVKKRSEALDIVSLELVSPAGSPPLPRFSAGAHIDVQIKPGLIRQYSLCNNPDESHRYVIGVLRDPSSRGGSVAMHDEVQEGELLQISEPKNHFPLANARRSLLFAGGIGVTPILCMAERLAHTGAQFEMHYCARSCSRTAFYDRIAARFASQVHFHFDDGDAAQKLQLAELLGQADPDTHLYVCGPAGFIDHVLNTARARGWAEPNIHFEHFAAKPIDTSDDGSFEVRIASTGRTIRIAADQSVTQALHEHGIEIPVSCEQGVCGTCITRVLAGEPDHRDLLFSDAEKALNDQFTPCCSRARSTLLVLDL
jgi:vanillate O-demethylase ferredoxin subunit